jgi:DNA-binding protein HU-beta
MKKTDFIRVIAEKTNISQKDTNIIITAALDTIQDILVNKESITFMGFGSFSINKRSARDIVLPNQKEKVHVPEKNRVQFRVGKNLKEAVANKK